MQVYLYAKSGHNIGLDATRRCATVATILQEFDPILCTSDFRAGAYAKEHLNIKKYVSVDVLSNLPNIMQRGDILIYESDEADDFMESHMREFCSLMFKIGKDIPQNIVNTTIFQQQAANNDSKVLFFGDDDYKNLLPNLAQTSSKHNIDLLMGHYFFLGNEKELTPYFNTIIDEEEYVTTIQNTKYLLCSSVNACLESAYCGNSPTLFKRPDKEYLNLDLIKSLGIPIVKNSVLEKGIEEFEEIVLNYPTLGSYKAFDMNFIYDKIKSTKDINNPIMTK